MLSVIMLNVAYKIVMLSVVMLSAVVLSATMLSVVEPFNEKDVRRYLGQSRELVEAQSYKTFYGQV